MPYFIYRDKGEKYYRYYYYFDNPNERVRGSTRRQAKEAARKVAKQVFEEALLERDGWGQAVRSVRQVAENSRGT